MKLSAHYQKTLNYTTEQSEIYLIYIYIYIL